jgi:hypothetical protein
LLTYAQLKQPALANPEVKAAYETLADVYALAREFLHAGESTGLKPAEVVDRIRTKAPAIARLEAGEGIRPPS